MIDCKICNLEFANDKVFHSHLKKIHGIFQCDYYVKHYSKKSLLFQKPIPFFDKKDYFEREFIDYNEFCEWCFKSDEQEVRKKIETLIKKRIELKDHKFAPFHLELKTLDLPSIALIKQFFGSYKNLCQTLYKEPLFGKVLIEDFNDVDENLEVLIDTREQMPLYFRKCHIEKLFVGDYLLASSDSCNTFVDRKSAADFIGTLSFHNLKRFKAEIEKAQGLDSYLFVVIEDTLESVIIEAKKFRKNSSYAFVFHNMREICHKYPRRVQFLFSGSREKSQALIPKLLVHGRRLWKTDLQYYIDRKKI